MTRHAAPPAWPIARAAATCLFALLALIATLLPFVATPATAQRAPRYGLAVMQDVLLGDNSLAGGPAHWTPAQAARLATILESSGDDGLPQLVPLARGVRDALRDGSLSLIDTIAQRAAIRLLEARRIGCCNASLRHDWVIVDDAAPSAEAAIQRALSTNRIDALFSDADPIHPWYHELRAALATEADPTRRRIIIANMDRWRWMPRDLGRRYILVNEPAYEASLWQDGVEITRWRVVVGRTRSPTPVFAASITGVILNPWWEIPQSIVAESIGALRRTNPREFARRGYVVQDGRYRQRPGPGNALGRMKLVMPNGYAVYLHDTPAQGLFANDMRAASHGCVRVDDALGLATTLLSTRADGWTRADTDAVVRSGRTQMVPLAQAVPVYMTYFTAEPDGTGAIQTFDDIYGRDRP